MIVNKLKNLNNQIISCKQCKRLVEFREKIANEKRKQYFDDEYWGKAVHGFGDRNAKILVVGLAPAAHGANRTGRVFTGDKSSDFLFKCLYKSKISNLERSIDINDSLKLKNMYITLALKCVPPNDKPTSNELKNCFRFFKEELNILKNVEIMLALGKIAFDTCINFFNLKKSKYPFKHGQHYVVNKKIQIIACYHPSPRNVNTGLINEIKMNKVLDKAKRMIETTL